VEAQCAHTWRVSEGRAAPVRAVDCRELLLPRGRVVEGDGAAAVQTKRKKSRLVVKVDCVHLARCILLRNATISTTEGNSPIPRLSDNASCVPAASEDTHTVSQAASVRRTEG
jgi:hypothetical protein